MIAELRLVLAVGFVALRNARGDGGDESGPKLVVH